MKTAFVLGGTNAHIPLLKELRRRGYYTVLIDYYDNPPAKVAADEHLQESTLNKEKVLEIARKRNAELVISTSVDQANAVACYVSEKLNLPSPYSYDTAKKVANKISMKQILFDSEIPTARYIQCDAATNVQELELHFPVVVKPADSNGSAGVRKANNKGELARYFTQAIEISRVKEAVVEEFKEGIEVSVDCVVIDCKAHVIMTRQKYNIIDGEGAVIQCYASLAPANISESAQQSIHSIAQQITHAFSLKNTSLLIQVIVKNDEVYVIEFSPRIGGGLSFETIFRNTGFDMIDFTVDTYLNLKKAYVWNRPDRLFTANNVYASQCVFGSVSGIEKLKSAGIIEDFFFYKTVGMETGLDMSSKSRVGAFIISAKNNDELLEKTKQAIDGLDVYDINGNNVMRKDIYLGMV